MVRLVDSLTEVGDPVRAEEADADPEKGERQQQRRGNVYRVG